MKSISNDDIQELKTWLGSGSINIFGLPFSGKDTHGRILAEVFDASVLGGGDILRNSVLTPEVKASLDAGKLTPTADYIRIVLPYLSRDEFADKPLILSSVGRWVGEEDGVIQACEAAHHPIKAVIYLHLDEQTSHHRYTLSQAEGDRGNRADDTEQVLLTRYNEFYTKTQPVIEKYRSLGLLTEIDGIPPKDEVSETILRELLKIARA